VLDVIDLALVSLYVRSLRNHAVLYAIDLALVSLYVRFDNWLALSW
jgi:hypothetical protein